MSKTKVKVEKNPVPAPEADVAPVVAPESVTPEAFKPQGEWPESSVSGKFNSVAFKEGHVVFNPSGQRLTEVISKTEADEIVRAQNRAAQL